MLIESALIKMKQITDFRDFVRYSYIDSAERTWFDPTALFQATYKAVIKYYLWKVNLYILSNIGKGRMFILTDVLLSSPHLNM